MKKRLFLFAFTVFSVSALTFVSCSNDADVITESLDSKNTSNQSTAREGDVMRDFEIYLEGDSENMPTGILRATNDSFTNLTSPALLDNIEGNIFSLKPIVGNDWDTNPGPPHQGPCDIPEAIYATLLAQANFYCKPVYYCMYCNGMYMLFVIKPNNPRCSDFDTDEGTLNNDKD